MLKKAGQDEKCKDTGLATGTQSYLGCDTEHFNIRLTNAYLPGFVRKVVYFHLRKQNTSRNNSQTTEGS